MANDIQKTKEQTLQSYGAGIVGSVLKALSNAEGKKEVAFPKNYHYANALKSAQLALLETVDKNNKPALEVCTKESITEALMRMATLGLNVAKNQCYFIVWGNKLRLSVSYFGKIAIAKRINGIKDVKAYALYDGDKFKTKFNPIDGSVSLVEYEPEFSNINSGGLIGGVALVIGESGIIHTELMNMAQIRAAWEQGPNKGNSGAHKKFTEEMVKKTVINRALKGYINVRDDSDLDFGDDLSDLGDEYMEAESVEVPESVKKSIEENANQELIDIDEPGKEPEQQPEDVPTDEPAEEIGF